MSAVLLPVLSLLLVFVVKAVSDSTSTRPVDLVCPPVREGESVTLQCTGSWKTTGRWVVWKRKKRTADGQIKWPEVASCDKQNPCELFKSNSKNFAAQVHYDLFNKPDWFNASLEVYPRFTRAKNRDDEYQCVIADYDDFENGITKNCILSIYSIPKRPKCHFTQSNVTGPDSGHIATNMTVQCGPEVVYPSMLCQLRQRWSFLKNDEYEEVDLDVQFEYISIPTSVKGYQYNNESCQASFLIHKPGIYRFSVRVWPEYFYVEYSLKDLGFTSAYSRRIEVVSQNPVVKIVKKTSSPNDCPDQRNELVCYGSGFLQPPTFEWFVGNERVYRQQPDEMKNIFESNLRLDHLNMSFKADVDVTCRGIQGNQSVEDTIRHVNSNLYQRPPTSLSKLKFFSENGHELRSVVSAIEGTVLNFSCRSRYKQVNGFSIYVMCSKENKLLLKDARGYVSGTDEASLQVSLTLTPEKNHSICVCWIKVVDRCNVDRAVVSIDVYPATFFVKNTGGNSSDDSDGSKRTVILLVMALVVVVIILIIVSVRCVLKSRKTSYLQGETENNNAVTMEGHIDPRSPLLPPPDQMCHAADDPLNGQPAHERVQIEETVVSDETFVTSAPECESSRLATASDKKLSSRGDFVASPVARRVRQVMVSETEEETRPKEKYSSSNRVHSGSTLGSTRSQTSPKLQDAGASDVSKLSALEQIDTKNRSSQKKDCNNQSESSGLNNSQTWLKQPDSNSETNGTSSLNEINLQVNQKAESTLPSPGDETSELKCTFTLGDRQLNVSVEQGPESSWPSNDSSVHQSPSKGSLGNEARPLNSTPQTHVAQDGTESPGIKEESRKHDNGLSNNANCVKQLSNLGSENVQNNVDTEERPKNFRVVVGPSSEDFVSLDRSENKVCDKTPSNLDVIRDSNDVGEDEVDELDLGSFDSFSHKGSHDEVDGPVNFGEVNGFDEVDGLNNSQNVDRPGKLHAVDRTSDDIARPTKSDDVSRNANSATGEDPKSGIGVSSDQLNSGECNQEVTKIPNSIKESKDEGPNTASNTHFGLLRQGCRE